MSAYEQCLGAINTMKAPWYIVPADDKKHARLITSSIILDTLKKLKMSYPKTDEAQRKELKTNRKQLLEEKQE